MLRVDVGPPAPGGLEEDDESSLPDSDFLVSVVEPSSFAIGTLEVDAAPPDPPARPLRGVSLNWNVMSFFCSNQRAFGLAGSYIDWRTDFIPEVP